MNFSNHYYDPTSPQRINTIKQLIPEKRGPNIHYLFSEEEEEEQVKRNLYYSIFKPYFSPYLQNIRLVQAEKSYSNASEKEFTPNLKMKRTQPSSVVQKFHTSFFSLFERGKRAVEIY